MPKRFKHPAQPEGTHYLGNYTRKGFEMSRWETKQLLEEEAYNFLDGQIIDQSNRPERTFPVFVATWEWEQRLEAVSKIKDSFITKDPHLGDDLLESFNDEELLERIRSFSELCKDGVVLRKDYPLPGDGESGPLFDLANWPDHCVKGTDPDKLRFFRRQYQTEGGPVTKSGASS